MRTSHGSMLEEIRSGKLPDDVGDVIGEFKLTFAVSSGDGVGDPTKTDAEELGDAQSQKTLATE
jgi:hypothetical protein